MQDDESVTWDVETGTAQGAFFDLERTITADAVEQVASLAMWRQGSLRWPQVARVLWCYLRYNLGLLEHFEELKAEGARVFHDRRPEEDHSLLEALYDERLRAAIFPDARRLIAEAHRLGFCVAIISSTYRFMVAPYARELGVEHFFGCELQVRDGRCTGQLQGPIYHQQSKADCVHMLAREHGLSLEHSYAFGDSMNDVAMLEAVGRPIVVNPGTRLKQRADEQGWTVAHWQV